MKGNTRRATTLAEYLHSFLITSLAAAGTLPKVNSLQKRVGELESELSERTTQRDAAVKEQIRLQAVESTLTSRVERLIEETSSLKTAHQKELDALLQAWTEVEEALLVEWNAVVKRLEDAQSAHQQELTATKTRANILLLDMHEMDDLVAGKLLILLRLCFRSRPSTLQLALCPTS